MTTTSRRRGLQFRLRTLFVAVAMLAIPLAWLGWQVNCVRHRKAVADWLSEQTAVFGFTEGGEALSKEKIWICVRHEEQPYRRAAIREWLGDSATRTIVFPVREPTAEELDALRAFPEATIYAPSGRW